MYSDHNKIIDVSFTKPVILFDGLCNLCNGSVHFIIRNDLKAIFVFSTLQSDTGKSLLNYFEMSDNNLYSILLVDKGRLYDRSEALLRVATHLRFPWNLFVAFRIIPAFILNPLYNLMANFRYLIFGKKAQCMVPTPELSKRFLD